MEMMSYCMQSGLGINDYQAIRPSDYQTITCKQLRKSVN